MKLFIPAWHYRARAIIQRTWGWSPIEEILLLQLDRSPGTINKVAGALSVPNQVVGSTFARLMQFGLIELRMSPRPLFATSAAGQEFIRSDRALPERTLDREIAISLVYEPLGQSVFRRRDVMIVSTPDSSASSRVLRFLDDEPPENDATMSERVGHFMAGKLRPGEWLRGVTAIGSRILRRHLVIDLNDVKSDSWPEGTSGALKRALLSTTKPGMLPTLTPTVRAHPGSIRTTFSVDQFILGAEQHLEAFERVVGNANSDVFVLSTFVASQSDGQGKERRERIWQALERACNRGVRCHLFLGTALDKDAKNAVAMQELRKRLVQGSLRRGTVFVHRDTVRSHVKILAADVGGAEAVVLVGSCNWLQSPYASVELCVELRESEAAATGLDILRSIVASLADASRSIETLQFMSAELRRSKREPIRKADAPSKLRGAWMTVLHADEHERLLRHAAHEATERFMCCTNKVGSTMVPALFNPSEIAGSRLNDVRVFYSRRGGPIKRRHVAVQRERLKGKARVIGVKDPQLHAKFLAWDNDHVVVSTMNWGSQSGLANNPLDEIGIYLEGQELASRLIERFEAMLPQDALESASDDQ